MSLKVWLPLDGDLRNLGISNIEVTNNGATINDNGKIGSCYHFGTTTSSMTLPKEAMTSFTTECSVTFWLKIKTWNTSYATYFQAGLGGAPWAHYIFGFLRNSSGSTICFTISNGSSASNAAYLTSTLELNKWYHVALTYKTGKCAIYLNGVLDHEYSTSLIPAFSSITHITLGACNNGTNYQTDCDMNDVRIYDHCLSAAEVHEISKGLVLHYKLDDIINGIIDSSGYGHNGEINGNLTISSNTAKYNNSTVFSGNNTAIKIPFNDIIKDKNYTISVWTYKSSIGTKNYQTILGGPSGFELDARSTSSTSPLYRIHNWGGGTTAYEFNQWNLFTFVHTSNDSKLYVNGELKITGVSNSIPIGDYYIGAWKTASQQNYEGQLSDFRIYCTPLLDKDVKILYNTNMRIDNLGNLYAFEYIEDEEEEKNTIQGLLKTNEIEEYNGTVKIKKNKGWLSPNFIEM